MRTFAELLLSDGSLSLFPGGYTQMPVFMVERDLPGITMEQLAAAQKAVIQAGKELTAEGTQVRYIRSIFVSGESKCMCLFEAPNAENVRKANERAQIPFRRIVPAEDLTPAA
jgi:hypothetical protein